MRIKARILAGILIAVAVVTYSAHFAFAQGYRQYYSSWTYYESKSYYVSTYYYKDYADASSYNYNYCTYYPSQPQYVYYYNPQTQLYWGRFDLDGKPGAQYSLLDKKDRKNDLKAIPESAFPRPGKMPGIPGAKDDVAMEPIKDKPTEAKDKTDKPKADLPG